MPAAERHHRCTPVRCCHQRRTLSLELEVENHPVTRSGSRLHVLDPEDQLGWKQDNTENTATIRKLWALSFYTLHLGTWRLRGDLIETYKTLTGKKNIHSSLLFHKASRGTIDLRGHSLKLLKKRSQLDIRKYFFSQRIIYLIIYYWNKLPDDVSAATGASFRNRLDGEIWT